MERAQRTSHRRTIGRLLIPLAAASLGVVVSVPASSSTARGLPSLDLNGGRAVPVEIVFHRSATSSDARASTTRTASTGLASPGAPAHRIGPPPPSMRAAGLGINVSPKGHGSSEQSHAVQVRIEENRTRVESRIAEQRNR